MGTGFEYQLRGRRENAARGSFRRGAQIVARRRGSPQGRGSRRRCHYRAGAFELPQCDATKRAMPTSRASPRPCCRNPLPPRSPTAENGPQACWLVFDFGSGTFDAALVTSRDGTMHVVNHGGGNFLGSSDIDWAIVERLLAPQIASEYPHRIFSPRRSAPTSTICSGSRPRPNPPRSGCRGRKTSTSASLLMVAGCASSRMNLHPGHCGNAQRSVLSSVDRPPASCAGLSRCHQKLVCRWPNIFARPWAMLGISPDLTVVIAAGWLVWQSGKSAKNR